MALAEPRLTAGLAVVEFLAPLTPTFRVVDGFNKVERIAIGHYRLTFDNVELSPTDPGLAVFLTLEDLVNALIITYSFVLNDNKTVDIFTHNGLLLADADTPFSVRLEVAPTTN